MKSATIALIAGLALSACETGTPPPEVSSLPYFGDGYRDTGDICRRVGEDAFTNQFLDDSADLVGCPADYEGLGVFVTDTGADQVGELNGHLLYSVPRG